MKYDVISFGSAILDVFIRCPEAVIEKTKKARSGQLLTFPYGEKLEVEELFMASGGGGTNTAVGFARLGLKSAVAARSGWDLAGKLIRQELKKEGVSDELLMQIEGEQTDYSTILSGPDGGRTILVYRGETRMGKEMINLTRLNAFWFYIASMEGNVEFIGQLVEHAKKHHIKVAINPGRRELAKKEALLPILKEVDVLILNQEEAAELTGSSSLDVKFFKETALVSKGVVAVTRGDKGVVLFDQQSQLLEAKSFKVRMVDATGAGDGFGSGFVSGLARGMGLEEALKLGVANGASVVTQVGSKPGLIFKKHEHNWLEKRLSIERNDS